MCGDEISIADISAACELFQGRFIQLDLAKWPKVQAWEKALIYGVPELLEVHQPVMKLAEQSLKKQGPKL